MSYIYFLFVSLLLDDPFLPVQVGRIVAYEEEEGSFIYAQIKEIHGEVGPSGHVTLDTKKSIIKVLLLDVFFFPKTKELNSCSTLDAFHGDPSSDEAPTNTEEIDEVFEGNGDKFSKTLREIFKEISDQLEKQYTIFKADEKAWKKFVKRMFLKWHPDKNVGNEEKATKVSQYIQNEVKRIENGKQRPNYDEYGSLGYALSCCGCGVFGFWGLGLYAEDGGLPQVLPLTVHLTFF